MLMRFNLVMQLHRSLSARCGHLARLAVLCALFAASGIAPAQAQTAVRSTGYNVYGQLGDLSITNRSLYGYVYEPTGAIFQAIAISAGYYHSVALDVNNRVWTWGYNYYGQLGYPTNYATANPNTLPAPLPTSVPPMRSISAGWYHTLSLDLSGNVWAWGYNANGELGDGTVVTRYTPAIVPGLPPIVAISAGGFHSLALDNTGHIWAWGYNGFGELGIGTNVTQLSPVMITSIFNVIAIAAGGYHSLAIAATSTGTLGPVYGWGLNNDGQVGDSTNINRLAPVVVLGGGVFAIAAGGFHSLAITTGAATLGWGYNADGQVGDNTLVNRNHPVATVGPGAVSTIAAGAYHSIAIRNGGQVWAWGYNAFGQLGDGALINRLAPVHIPFGTVLIMNIAGGGLHSLAR